MKSGISQPSTKSKKIKSPRRSRPGVEDLDVDSLKPPPRDMVAVAAKKAEVAGEHHGDGPQLFPNDFEEGTNEPMGSEKTTKKFGKKIKNDNVGPQLFPTDLVEEDTSVDGTKQPSTQYPGAVAVPGPGGNQISSDDTIAVEESSSTSPRQVPQRDQSEVLLSAVLVEEETGPRVVEQQQPQPQPQPQQQQTVEYAEATAVSPLKNRIRFALGFVVLVAIIVAVIVTVVIITAGGGGDGDNGNSWIVDGSISIGDTGLTGKTTTLGPNTFAIEGSGEDFFHFSKRTLNLRRVLKYFFPRSVQETSDAPAFTPTDSPSHTIGPATPTAPAAPTFFFTASPSAYPTTATTQGDPTFIPTISPITSPPTREPTLSPITSPPTREPTLSPITSPPTGEPTLSPVTPAPVSISLSPTISLDTESSAPTAGPFTEEPTAGQPVEQQPDRPDTVYFSYQLVEKSFSVLGRVCDETWNTGDKGRAGIMIRNTLNPLSSNIFMAFTPNIGGTLTYRSSPAEPSVANVGDATMNQATSSSSCLWVRLDRISTDRYIPYWAMGGSEDEDVNNLDWETWLSSPVTVSIVMEDPVYVGMAMISGNVDVANTVIFENLQLS